jgi:hypothetical protein
MFKNDKCTESRISHHLYVARELIAVLTGCGFSRGDAYGDLEGGLYNQNAKRMVVVGRK